MGGNDRTAADRVHLSQELDCHIQDANGGNTGGRATAGETCGDQGHGEVLRGGCSAYSD